MDSCSEYAGFMDLLHSQQEIHFGDSFSPTMPLGSSQDPLFCDDPTPPVEYSSEEKREGRPKWKIVEDKALISAWLNTSKDAVVGNEQKAAAFWSRIATYYASCEQVSGLRKRGPSQCKQRWGKINDIVCKFCGSFEAAKREKTSGFSENDIMKAAYEIFFNDHGFKFTLEHAWRELRFDQKWCTSSTTKVTGRPKRRKCDEANTSSHTVIDVEAETLARPPGVKASKAKRKKRMSKTTPLETDGKTLLAFQDMWEIREKDLAARKRLNKMTLLNSLLAKGDQISEIEQTLMNKLINVVETFV